MLKRRLTSSSTPSLCYSSSSTTSTMSLSPPMPSPAIPHSAPLWSSSPYKGQDAPNYEDYSSSSSHQDHSTTATKVQNGAKQTSTSASTGGESPTPYYTVFGSTSGRVVAVGSPEDSTWDAYKHGYWDSSVLGNRSVTVSVGEKAEKKKGLRTITRKVSERWRKQSVAGGVAVVGRMDDEHVARRPASAGVGVRMSVDSARAQAQAHSNLGQAVLGGPGRASMQERRPAGLNTPFTSRHASGAALPRSPLPSPMVKPKEGASSQPTTLRKNRSTLAPHQEQELQAYRRSLRLSIDKFPDVNGPHLPLLPARADQQPPRSPYKDSIPGGNTAPRSFSQSTGNSQPQSQQRPHSRNTPGTPTIASPGSASPSTSSVSVSTSQRHPRAPSTPSVTSSNGTTSGVPMSPVSTTVSASGSGSGGKFWKLMRRLSVGGLKEKYHEAGGEDAPPVPPLPPTLAPAASPMTAAAREDRGRVDGELEISKIGHSQPKRSKSLEAELMQRGRNHPSEKPPVPNLPRSSMSSGPPRHSMGKRPSTGVHPSSPTTASRPSTIGRPSTATRSSSPVSSDMASSKRFFYKAQSGGSSSSSFLDDGIAKPPLPLPVGASPLAQHIIPPPELGKVHERENLRSR